MSLVLQASLTSNLILCPRYCETVSDVLNSVKKMEESLKRLKQARRAPATSTVGPSSGMSDDDKIRLQLALDVEYLGEQVLPWRSRVQGPGGGIGICKRQASRLL